MASGTCALKGPAGAALQHPLLLYPTTVKHRHGCMYALYLSCSSSEQNRWKNAERAASTVQQSQRRDNHRALVAWWLPRKLEQGHPYIHLLCKCPCHSCATSMRSVNRSVSLMGVKPCPGCGGAGRHGSHQQTEGAAPLQGLGDVVPGRREGPRQAARQSRGSRPRRAVAAAAGAASRGQLLAGGSAADGSGQAGGQLAGAAAHLGAAALASRRKARRSRSGWRRRR